MLTAQRKDSGGRATGQVLKDHLLQEMVENRIPLGGQLPTENELMAKFALGRSTVRRVLQDLQIDGLVDRQQGRGTFRIAGNKRRQKTMLVGVWFNAPASPLFGPMAEGIQDELARWQYHAVIERGGLDPGDERRGIESLIHKGLDGFIVAPSSNPDDDHAPLLELIDRDIPLVLVDRPFPGCETNLVLPDRRMGAEEAVSHLIELGHKRIAYLGVEGIRTEDERLAGYRKTMARHRLPIHPDWVQNVQRLRGDRSWAGLSDVFVTSGGTRLSIESCREVVQTMLGLPIEQRPTATFAITAELAETFVGLIQEHGLRTPQDMSVVGFGDKDSESGGSAWLTTYAQPSYRVGEEAAGLLIRRIQNPSGHVTSIYLPGKLVVRGSTAPPR
jgi:DNA-binding LacI/PurR family transcriptional regulator